MRDYVVQYNNGVHSCGPIVLLNALRHQGHKVGRRHLPFLARKLKSRGDGVYVRDLQRVAREMGAFRRMYRVKDAKIREELCKGNAIAVRVGMEEKTASGTTIHGHYFLISGIWIKGLTTSYYMCNLGRRCKWREFADLERHYDKFYERWWISHFWVVPLKKKKGIRLPR